MDPTEIRELIARHPLFVEMGPEVVDRMVSAGRVARFPVGKILFQQSDDGDALYCVLGGRVRISRCTPDGREVIITLMSRGEIFGEMALLDNMPRTADATIEESATLLVVLKSEFQSLLRLYPILTLHLLRMICNRLRESNERVEDAALLPVPARLAKRLLNLNDKIGIGDPVRISQSDLGRFLGTSRESVNKHLKRWSNEGFLELGRNVVRLLDIEALKTIALGELEEDE